MGLVLCEPGRIDRGNVNAAHRMLLQMRIAIWNNCALQFGTNAHRNLEQIKQKRRALKS